jgi:hypothetical protein
MKTLKTSILVVTMVTSLIQLFAQKYDFLNLGNISKYSNERNAIIAQDSEMCCDEINNFGGLPRNARVHKITRSEVTFKDVTITEPGTLATVLGDEINDLDSLVVRGPINADDFHTMWSGSFYGGLSVLNLEYAYIDGNKLPKNAFWYQSEQYTPGSEYIDCILLRKVILPEGLEEIGEGAFSYAINLVDINLPSSIRVIKRRCFSDCVSLNVDPLIIPEGVEEIGPMAFVNCKEMVGRVVLPTTLKKIDSGAFFQCKITECNFPEGLEEIGDAAFYSSRLKEAIIPNTCQTFTGDCQFMLDYELEKVSLPEGLKVIPSSFVDDCIKLKEFIMPNSVEEIDNDAFWQCGSLQELHLSSNLKSIGTTGLYYCKGLKIISFPATLENLGAECCEYLKSIESIYCAAPIPPTCVNSEVNIGWTPFGKYGDDFGSRTLQEIPVYVPIGSADLYRNAWGWNYFTNFIETDDFPAAGAQMVTSENRKHDDAIYDIMGRRVVNPIIGRLYIVNGKKALYQPSKED